MARAVPSFGAQMNTVPLSFALAAVRLDSARFFAVLKSQLVVTWLMIFASSSRVSVAFPLRPMASLEFFTTNVPSAILGWRMLQAPWKNRNALLSDAAPAYRYRLLPLPLAFSER